MLNTGGETLREGGDGAAVGCTIVDSGTASAGSSGACPAGLTMLKRAIAVSSSELRFACGAGETNAQG
jgi:hypothetical protein